MIINFLIPGLPSQSSLFKLTLSVYLKVWEVHLKITTVEYYFRIPFDIHES